MALETISQKLKFLYPEYNTDELTERINTILYDFKTRVGEVNLQTESSEKDCFLITYGDSIYEEGKKSLSTLKKLLDNKIKGLIPNIHILPFYPYSSDDGFSVKDYFKVNPLLGDWSHIKDLSKNYSLMFDGVINHISSKSDWFISYLKGDRSYKNYFIETDPDEDLSKVTRPRALPLLTEFKTDEGVKSLWTTFSDDQVDLNYKDPELFLKILELILFYIEKGATFLRLDAIGFLWKEIGTSCIHLPETHTVIQLYRQIIEQVVNGFVFITETNVPHKDNISYFGNGYNEASLVYQFPLPPLVLNAILNNNGKYLTNWAQKLETPSDKTGFFNFLASHDGIGLNPVRGIIPEDEILEMAEHVKKSGGLVSYKTNPDGTSSPYELNISLFNAFSKSGDSEDILIRKFILAHAILLSFSGSPAIYIHSLLGSVNYYKGVEETGRNRTINREKLELNKLLDELDDSSSRRYKIYNAIKNLLEVRGANKAFNPNGEQEILQITSALFAIIRTSVDKEERVLGLFNLTSHKISIDDILFNAKYTNLFTNEVSETISELDAYSFFWLKLEE